MLTYPLAGRGRRQRSHEKLKGTETLVSSKMISALTFAVLDLLDQPLRYVFELQKRRLIVTVKNVQRVFQISDLHGLLAPEESFSSNALQKTFFRHL